MDRQGSSARTIVTRTQTALSHLITRREATSQLGSSRFVRRCFDMNKRPVSHAPNRWDSRIAAPPRGFPEGLRNPCLSARGSQVPLVGLVPERMLFWRERSYARARTGRVGVEAAFIVVNVPVLDRLAPLVGSDDNPRTLIGREFALGNNISPKRMC